MLLMESGGAWPPDPPVPPPLVDCTVNKDCQILIIFGNKPPAAVTFVLNLACYVSSCLRLACLEAGVFRYGGSCLQPVIMHVIGIRAGSD